MCHGSTTLCQRPIPCIIGWNNSCAMCSLANISLCGSCNKGYKLYRRFYMDGTNLGYSWYGAPTGKSLDGKMAICQSMSTLELVDDKWMITYEYTMYADEWMRQVCTPDKP